MGPSPPSPESGQAHISLVMALNFNFILQRGGGWDSGKQLPGPHPRGFEGSSLKFGRPFGALFHDLIIAALARGRPGTLLPCHGPFSFRCSYRGGVFCPEVSRPSFRGPPAPPRPPSAHQFNRTPLHDAALYGHLSVVQWLLEKGAEVDAKDNVRGDPTGQGDPEGVGKGLWGPSPPHLERNCSSPSPGP